MMSKQYEQLQQLISITSMQILGQQRGEQLLKQCEQSNQTKTNQDHKNMEMPKGQDIKNQENRHKIQPKKHERMDK